MTHPNRYAANLLYDELVKLKKYRLMVDEHVANVLRHGKGHSRKECICQADKRKYSRQIASLEAALSLLTGVAHE